MQFLVAALAEVSVILGQFVISPDFTLAFIDLVGDFFTFQA